MTASVPDVGFGVTGDVIVSVRTHLEDPCTWEAFEAIFSTEMGVSRRAGRHKYVLGLRDVEYGMFLWNDDSQWVDSLDKVLIYPNRAAAVEAAESIHISVEVIPLNDYLDGRVV
jgi:hypothetical protein